MQADRVAALALALASLGLLLLAALAAARLGATRRGARALAMALERRAAVAAAAVNAPSQPAHPLAQPAAGAASQRVEQSSAVFADSGRGLQRAQPAPNATAKDTSHAKPRADARPRTLLERFAVTGAHWLDTPLGRLTVAAEDRHLLDQCGFVDAKARGLFLILRLGCAVVLSASVGWLWKALGTHWFACAVAIVAGFMLPKIALTRRAAARRRSVTEELPMLVDLLRLLQGVGLSLDQSMQVVINDFRAMLPVLSSELEIAQRQFVAGRTREQSLHRLATSFGNENLRAVVRLMVQVDRHGGAVQEPLKQFGDRLRETRRADLRERIGRLTVKMTGVMILTLLPALLIVTAGPGVMTATQILAANRR